MGACGGAGRPPASLAAIHGSHTRSTLGSRSRSSFRANMYGDPKTAASSLALSALGPPTEVAIPTLVQYSLGSP